MDIAAAPASVTGHETFVLSLDPVRTADRTTRVMADAGLVALFLAAAAIEAIAVAQSWGLAYWVIGGAAAALICVLALIRRQGPFWCAVGGLTIATGTAVAAAALDMPAEPGPAMALALAVLTGAAVRAAPTVRAASVGFAALGVVVASQIAAGGWDSGPAPVTWLNLLTWLGGIATGLSSEWWTGVPGPPRNASVRRSGWSWPVSYTTWSPTTSPA